MGAPGAPTKQARAPNSWSNRSFANIGQLPSRPMGSRPLNLIGAARADVCAGPSTLPEVAPLLRSCARSVSNLKFFPPPTLALSLPLGALEAGPAPGDHYKTVPLSLPDSEWSGRLCSKARPIPWLVCTGQSNGTPAGRPATSGRCVICNNTSQREHVRVRACSRAARILASRPAGRPTLAQEARSKSTAVPSLERLLLDKMHAPLVPWHWCACLGQWRAQRAGERAAFVPCG